MSDFTATEQLIEAATDAMSVVWQYKSDLLYPPTNDSIGRRLARASEVAVKLECALKASRDQGSAGITHSGAGGVAA